MKNIIVTSLIATALSAAAIGCAKDRTNDDGVPAGGHQSPNPNPAPGAPPDQAPEGPGTAPHARALGVGEPREIPGGGLVDPQGDLVEPTGGNKDAGTKEPMAEGDPKHDAGTKHPMAEGDPKHDAGTKHPMSGNDPKPRDSGV